MLALEADAVAVADDEHPEHQLGINRWTADIAVEEPQCLTKLDQHARHDGIDAAQEVALRNALFEIEQVEQLALITCLPPHHARSPSPTLQVTESRFADDHEPFFNSIGQNAT